MEAPDYLVCTMSSQRSTLAPDPNGPLTRDAARSYARNLRKRGVDASVMCVPSGIFIAGSPAFCFRGDLSHLVT